ncbi:hypothetical protein DQQ10_27465 [Pseudochryseolinea flava]|uniref:Uncharacterized protein n=2 Tax=Pseudochryseolinea flava TaxID=2059302 RepID=A0A364XV99_9BACT|nr:hypothetical protein DQQ10_27465 [Pseudochryseolinea flava]
MLALFFALSSMLVNAQELKSTVASYVERETSALVIKLQYILEKIGAIQFKDFSMQGIKLIETGKIGVQFRDDAIELLHKISN